MAPTQARYGTESQHTSAMSSCSSGAGPFPSSAAGRNSKRQAEGRGSQCAKELHRLAAKPDLNPDEMQPHRSDGRGPAWGMCGAACGVPHCLRHSRANVGGQVCFALTCEWGKQSNIDCELLGRAWRRRQEWCTQRGGRCVGPAVCAAQQLHSELGAKDSDIIMRGGRR